MSNNNPYIEKYRPHGLKEVIGLDNIKKVFYHAIEHKEMPHLMLCGQSGIGKTTVVYAFINQYYNRNDVKNHVLELNGSDEKGIDTVRLRIIDFAKLKAKEEYKFKVIIVDEADGLTNESQCALKKVLDDSINTKFIFMCNFKHHIIDAILSRCLQLNFKNNDPKIMQQRLAFIARRENIQVNDKQLESIITNSNNDMRSAIMAIQHLKYGSIHKLNYVTPFINFMKDPNKSLISKVAYCKSIYNLALDNNYLINELDNDPRVDKYQLLLYQINSAKGNSCYYGLYFCLK